MAGRRGRRVVSDAARVSGEGLTGAQVAERVRLGQTNAGGVPTSRSVAGILRRDVFTFFNGLLFVLLVAILAFGQARDALFGFVLFLNMAISIVQELRAKATLDKLSLLAAPAVSAVRDGVATDVVVADVVLDDVIELRRGDQAVVDGVVLSASGMEVDESLLTGEARPVAKRAGDRVMSGSFCVAGSGRMRADAVGPASYAQRLAAEAKRFRRVPSELRVATDRILKTVTVFLVPIGVLLAATRWVETPPAVAATLVGHLRAVIPETVAGLIGMIPQGLVLLTSMAFALSVIKLARRRALVEELPAVEVLARVDVVCFDKTGTLTEADLEVVGFDLLEGAEEAAARAALGALAAADPPEARNPTARAIAASYPAPGPARASTVPFSSARKWSAVTLADSAGSWVLGAPDVLLSEGDAVRSRADALARAGARVVLLGRSDGPLAAPAPGDPAAPEPAAPPTITPVALVSLEEAVRSDVAAALAYFREEGVALKVLSGDAPATVASVAGRAGLDVVGEPVDGAGLPCDPAALAAFMESHTVFGRVSPEGKRDMVAALQAAGHVVAMAGDGVNDVPALKAADLGIAMGAGAPAARAVADLVLLDGRFSVLPDVIAEGRRVMSNVERVANLFVMKSVYAGLLALGAGLLVLRYPLLPRHFSLIDALTIGIPGFLLALAPGAPRYRPGMLGRVMRFTIPCGVVMAGASSFAYMWALRAGGLGADVVAQARTVTVWTLVFTGFWVVSELLRPFTRPKSVLLAAMAAGAFAVMFVPPMRAFFALPASPPGAAVVVVGATALAAVAIELALRLSGWRAATSGGGSAR
jgi:cation-transporting ATPase E